VVLFVIITKKQIKCNGKKWNKQLKKPNSKNNKEHKKRKDKKKNFEKKTEAEQIAIKKKEEERRRKEEEEARALAEEEALFLKEQEALRLQAEQEKNPIKAAALGLKLEANKWDAEGNKMIAMSNQLAEDMALLAELSQLQGPDAKKNLITLARKIAENAKVIEKEARKVADTCSDQRLKKDLQIVADRIPTIANQIKILSTVKAANPNDMDNDQMLVTAATNLMASVKTTIDASQSAHLRSFSTAAVVVTAAVRWKRKLKKIKLILNQNHLLLS